MTNPHRATVVVVRTPESKVPEGVHHFRGALDGWNALQELRSLLHLPLTWDPEKEGVRWLWQSDLSPAVRIRCAYRGRERLGDVWRTPAGGLFATFTKAWEYNDIVGRNPDGSAIRAGGFRLCLRMIDDLRPFGSPEEPVPPEQFAWVHCACEGARPLKPGSLARLAAVYERSLHSANPSTFEAHSASFLGSRAEARERNAR